jgi:hypothetical protein
LQGMAECWAGQKAGQRGGEGRQCRLQDRAERWADSGWQGRAESRAGLTAGGRARQPRGGLRAGLGVGQVRAEGRAGLRTGQAKAVGRTEGTAGQG